MMQERCVSVAVALCLAAAAPGQNKPVPGASAAGRSDSAVEASRLPVRRVILYKNGVGYFEHAGRVSGNQSVGINFTSAQLNDVLKSLTILDLGGGRIAGVTYGSEAPMERRLGEVALPVAEQTTVAEFLRSLRGARLELRAGASPVTGRLLSVERKTRVSGGTSLEADYLALITDAGEIRTIEFSPDLSARILDRSLAEQVSRYMGVLATARDADLRRMVVSAVGTGDRSLSVSYISEVPVWKTTYRVVLPSKPGDSPLLQGWAIVDNTVGEDWEGVELSLVAGAPNSFIQRLSQPYYSRRPVVPLPDNVLVAPQTHQATLSTGAASLAGAVTDPTGAVVSGARVRAYDSGGDLAAEATTTAGAYEFYSLADGTYRVQVERAGFRSAVVPAVPVSSLRPGRADVRLQVGSVAETVSVTASAPQLQTSAAQVSSLRNRSAARAPSDAASTSPQQQMQAEAAALAQGLGDLFEYRLKEPITIRKNESALVPIVQAPIVAEKVSIWNDSSRLTRPQRALWLTNSSGLTLDGGSFNVIEEGAFAGEGIFEPIRPGEKRLVSYATDLALTAGSQQDNRYERVSRVRVSRGAMIQEREVRERKTYTFRNADSSPRTVIIEHPARAGYELRGEARPAETLPGWLRFRLPVPPGQTASLVVEEGRPMEATYALGSLTGDQVEAFVRDKSISREVEDALRRILRQGQELEGLEAQIDGVKGQTEEIFKDQERLRENMKSLRGSVEEKSLLQRYTNQLNEQEDRLAALRNELRDLEEKQQRAQSDLERLRNELVFDVKL